MDYEKAIAAVNLEELEILSERLATHMRRFDIVLRSFVEFREKATEAFEIYIRYIPPEYRQLILDDLQSTIYLYEDLGECLQLFGEDVSAYAEHGKKSSRDMLEAIYGKER